MRRVVSVVALTAIIVAASGALNPASATILCSTKSNPCLGTLYNVGTVLEGSTPDAKIISSDASFNPKLSSFCSVTMTGKVTGIGTPLPAEFTGMPFSFCTGDCSTVKAVDLPWRSGMKAAGDGSGNGTFTLAGNTEGPIVEMSNCGKTKFSCRFVRDGTKLTWSFLGGNPAEIRSSAEPFILSKGVLAECGQYLQLVINVPLSQPAGSVYLM